MMDQMMGGGMMWGMGLLWLLVLVVLPLYTIWWTGTARENLVAVLHCAVGDILITTITLLIAALIGRFRGWPPLGRRVALTTIVLGVAYTILSEWLNVAVWQSWTYSS